MNEEKTIKLKEAVENLLDIFKDFVPYCREFKIDHSGNHPRMMNSLREKLEVAVKKIIMIDIEGTMYSVNEEKEPTSRKDLTIEIIDDCDAEHRGGIKYKNILNEKAG